MAKHAISNVYVELASAVDVSDRIENIKITLGRSAVDVTAIGDAWNDYVTGGVSRWAVTLSAYQDYCSSDTTGGASIYSIIKGMLNDTAGTTFLCRPNTSAAAATNPQISGTVTLDADFDLLTGAVNTANKFSVTLKGMGTPTFTEA